MDTTTPAGTIASALVPPPTPGALFVTPEQALYRPEFLSRKLPKNPTAAVRLLIGRHRFPLPLTKICGTNMVATAAITAFAGAGVPAGTPAPTAPAPSPKRGRPSKAEVERREIATLALQMAARGEVGHD